MFKFRLLFLALLSLLVTACLAVTGLTPAPGLALEKHDPSQEGSPGPPVTPVPTRRPGTLHFENDAVSFDYQKGMNLYTDNDPAFASYPRMDLGGEMVAALGDASFYKFEIYFRSIRLTRRSLPPGSSLEAVMQETYQQYESKFPIKPGMLDADGPVTINGGTGLQKTYRVYSGEPAYELRDIWFLRGDEVYILSIWTKYTNPDELAAFQSAADVLANSLVIK